MRDGYATLKKDEEDQEIRCKLNNKREAKIRRAKKSNKILKHFRNYGKSYQGV